jgi:hypothetical protein
MRDYSSIDQSQKVIWAGLTCGLCALVLGALLYVSLLDPSKTFEVLAASWEWLVSMALIAFIPVEATYHFVADLPLGVQIASLCAWLWAWCVCKKLDKYGVNGPAYQNMTITKHSFLTVFVTIFSMVLIKKGLFMPVFTGLFLIGILIQMIKDDIKRSKNKETAL